MNKINRKILASAILLFGFNLTYAGPFDADTSCSVCPPYNSGGGGGGGSGGGSSGGIVSDVVSRLGDMGHDIQWYVQLSPYLAAQKIENCQEVADSLPWVTISLDNGEEIEVKCDREWVGKRGESGLDGKVKEVPDGWIHNYSVYWGWTDVWRTHFMVKCQPGYEPNGTKGIPNPVEASYTNRGGGCRIEPSPKYQPLAGVLNDDYPAQKSPPPYSGNIGSSNNPIFVPPRAQDGIPTQVSNKRFNAKLVDPNIEIREVKGKNWAVDVGGTVFKGIAEWKYEVAWTNPWNPSECYDSEKPGCIKSMPLFDKEDIYYWIGGNFDIYLLDTMINPNYLEQCQSQGTNSADLSVLGTIPYYKAKEGALEQWNMAYGKSHRLDLLFPNGEGDHRFNPFNWMCWVQIPDAHQKLSFMPKFVPDSQRRKFIDPVLKEVMVSATSEGRKQVNICNIDTFSVRPAYYVTKFNNFKDNTNPANNVNFDKKEYNPDKARVISSSTSNYDVQTKFYYPVDYKKLATPNYQIGLGFYDKLPSTGYAELDFSLGANGATKLISYNQDVQSITTQNDLINLPYIKGVGNTCKYRTDTLYSEGYSDEDGKVGKGAKIWVNTPMKIEAIFSYFDKDRKYLGKDAAHAKIVEQRKKLLVSNINSQNLLYDEVELRSLISTHYNNYENSNERIFAYNNIAEALVHMVDSKWTIYDQNTTDAIGRTRPVKCIINSAYNESDLNKNGIINGCNIETENNKDLTMTYVPDYIGLTPKVVTDKFEKDGKNFTYFANKVGDEDVEAMSEAQRSNQMFATFELDGTAYASSEVYGEPVERLDQKRPLVVYGYENYSNSGTCGKNVDYQIDLIYDCSNQSYVDDKIATKIETRCAVSPITEDYCTNFGLDSRCHGGIATGGKFINYNLKDKFMTFNKPGKSADKDGKPIKQTLTLKDFKLGSAQLGNKIYFNFYRTVNYPTNPKVINVNDFNATKIIQVGYITPSKDFVKPDENDTTKTTQQNRYRFMDKVKAIGNNAHFYYGYINSYAREYYVCGDGARDKCESEDNPVDVMVTIHGSLPDCQKYPQMCDSEFIDVFEKPKDYYLPLRKFYRNPYDYYEKTPPVPADNITHFAKKYRGIKTGITPSDREDRTPKGIEKIKFKKVPNDFAEDYICVETSPWFIYSDSRGVIKEDTTCNVFRLLAFKNNTWGGEGSVKYDPQESISGNAKETLESVGEVPMGKDLEKTSRSINRRVRY